MQLFATLVILFLLAASVGVGHAQVCDATESWHSGWVAGKKTMLSTVTVPSGCYFAYLGGIARRPRPSLSMVSRLSAPWLSTASSPAAIIYLIAACPNFSPYSAKLPATPPKLPAIPEVPCISHEFIPAVIWFAGADGNLQTPNAVPFMLPMPGAVGFVTTDRGQSFTALGAP